MSISKKTSPSQKLEAITETSCLVNVMHEVLVERWNNGCPSIAICPTQNLEGDIGLDVALAGFDKALGLQFKAYKRSRNKVLDYFAIYKSQHKTLLKYPYSCAFYVFPDYKKHYEMSQDKQAEYKGNRFKILNNTWFVEVHDISKRAKRVTRRNLMSGKTRSIRWFALSKRLTDCYAGFQVVKINGNYILMDKEERVVKVLEIPSGSFSMFYTTRKSVGPQHAQKLVFR
jgi:hypothetical protein